MNQELIKKAVALKSFYDGLKIGYNGVADCGFLVDAEPFSITSEDKANLLKQGNLFREWLKTSIGLVNAAYKQDSLAWLGALVEGSSSVDAVACHRQFHISDNVTLPHFIRPDMASLQQSVEVQIPGSGWGFMAAANKTVAGGSYWIGPAEAFVQTACEASGAPARCAYILYNSPFQREVEYFSSVCTELGADMQMLFSKVPSAMEGMFIRRPPMDDLFAYEGSREMATLAQKHACIVEPGLSLLFDQKLSMVFPFHPFLREFYSDAVRSLFPETHIVDNNFCPSFEGEKICWEQIPDLPPSRRQFILKYGGSRKGMRAGGKAVYNLADCKRNEVADLVARALHDCSEHRDYWLLQKRVKHKQMVRFHDSQSDQMKSANYYPLFRPLFKISESQDAVIAAFTVLFRNSWKVHGATDAVMLPVELL